MSPPVIFLSAATVDLLPWRQHLDTAFSRAGFRVLTQGQSLRSATGTVHRLLTETIADATCIIHLAGLGYGSHATAPFPAAPAFQCSWTQFEYYWAHQQGKDVIAFVCAPSLSTLGWQEDATDPADLALKAHLQDAHCQRVQSGKFTDTPLAATAKRTCNETVASQGHLLASVAAAVGTLHTLHHQQREAAQQELRNLAASLQLIEATVTETHHDVKDLAAQMIQLQTAFGTLQQQVSATRSLRDWPQEEIETALAAQMKLSLADLRALLTAGKTSLDALVAGQALLASGQAKEAGEKFDVVITQEQAALQRLRQAYAGKGQIAFHAVQYEDALAWRQKVLALVDKATAPLNWAEAAAEVEFVLDKLARYQDAEPLDLEIVRLREQHLPADDPLLASALNNLAQLYQDTNRLAEAEPLMERALKIDEKSYGPEHPKVAIRLNNLALLYKATDRLAEAEPLMERVVNILENKGGSPLPSYSAALNNLAQLYEATNRLAEAEPLMERALKIDEKSYGPEHPKVARHLNNLASLYYATHRLAKAEPLMERALKIDEKSLGPEHPKVARHLNNLASLYYATNRLAEAEPLYERALQINEKSYGPEHPDVATNLNNLALLYQDTNRLAEAEPLLRRALAIKEKSLGPEHPSTKLWKKNLAKLLKALGK